MSDQIPRLAVFCQMKGCDAPSEYQVLVLLGLLDGPGCHELYIGLVVCAAHRDEGFARKFVDMNREKLAPVARALRLDLEKAVTEHRAVKPRDRMIPDLP